MTCERCQVEQNGVVDGVCLSCARWDAFEPAELRALVIALAPWRGWLSRHGYGAEAAAMRAQIVAKEPLR